MKLILAIVKPFKVTEIVDAVHAEQDFPGLTVCDARGFGREKTCAGEHPRGGDLHDFTNHSVLLIAVPADRAESYAEMVRSVAHTGRPGDGKVFTLDIDRAIRIGTGNGVRRH